jgi:hypothetical protein
VEAERAENWLPELSEHTARLCSKSKVWHIQSLMMRSISNSHHSAQSFLQDSSSDPISMISDEIRRHGHVLSFEFRCSVTVVTFIRSKCPPNSSRQRQSGHQLRFTSTLRHSYFSIQATWSHWQSVIRTLVCLPLPSGVRSRKMGASAPRQKRTTIVLRGKTLWMTKQLSRSHLQMRRSASRAAHHHTLVDSVRHINSSLHCH